MADYSRAIGATLLAICSAGMTVTADADAILQRNDFIEKLLTQMTLKEKAGQLTQLRVLKTPTGTVWENGNDDDTIRRGEVGSLLGAYGVETTLRLQRLSVEESRLHIPLLFALDVIHGFKTVFPVPLAEASAWDPELSRRTARAAAKEATASGLHWTYAPMVDITRDPRWGRVVEGAGEDPYLGSALAVARVRGFRGPRPPSPSSMLATAKHFVAYGAAEGGRDYNVADISERTLREVYLPPFHAAVQAGADVIMPGFNEVAGIPMHANPSLLRDRLRTEWGFKGIVVSDFNAVRQLIEHGVAATPAAATRLALEATIDIDMVSGLYRQELPTLVRNGQVPLRLLDDAVRRVLLAKLRLGLFDAPYRYSDLAREHALTKTAEARALAREAAQKSIVLLKNDNATLPLPKDLKRLVVVGALAADAQSSSGPWVEQGDPETVTVLEGIKNAVSSQTEITYVPGASPTSTELDRDNILNAIEGADAVIAVVGETAEMTGEARSRASLDLPGAQDALLSLLREKSKVLVMVLMNGRPLAMPEVSEQIPAILETWFLGSEMGHGVADILFGDVNPSGKLPIAFPRSVGQIPLYFAHKNTGRPPTLQDPNTSKYMDQPWTPRYPFGHGLSYTTFTYGTPTLSATRIAADGVLTVHVKVSNTGQRSGEEIVQLYLHQSTASVTRPTRTLRGFARVMLTPGETRTVSFRLDQDDFALLDPSFTRRVEPGAFTVFIGGSSTTDNQAHFEIAGSTQKLGPGSAIPYLLRHTHSRE